MERTTDITDEIQTTKNCKNPLLILCFTINGKRTDTPATNKIRKITLRKNVNMDKLTKGLIIISLANSAMIEIEMLT